MTKQMLITLALMFVTVLVAASEAQQDRFVNALILAAFVWGFTAVFFRQKQVFSRRAVRVTK